jgi:predicted phage tail protein
MMHRHVIGSGGGKAGGDSPHVATEARDTLRSTSYARVLDLVCEGEIEGLVNGLQSVYLDGTPVQNPDGSTNFTGVSVAMVTGTQAQDPLPGIPATESAQAVGVAVVAATPVVRTITDATVDAVRVTLSFPGLSQQDTTNGDLNGASVQIAIHVQSNGGGYVAQSLSREWRSSPNPAVVAATGIALDVSWAPTGAADVDGNVAYASITFSVQYRVVGAGSWTTYKTDSFTTIDFNYVTDGDGYTTISYPTRTYDILGLVDALYEARVFKTSGDGSLSLDGFRNYTTNPYDTITGKTTSTYQRSYRIPLTGSAPWDVRVSRITPDSVSSALRNATVFSSYTEITDESFSYPNSAVVAISVDASQFQSIPSRGYDLKLLRVRIPSNYNPVTRVYTGIWDGTFTVAWTDNPAWCFYDLLTNTRYGLGSFLSAAQVDKWALYTIGVYCDGLVPNGMGGQEPRFTCNLYLQAQAEAFQVIVSMASIFRGMAYWAAGAITAVQDAPADPVFLFTEANVEGGLFTYSGTAKQARHTVALVTWNDPTDEYKPKPEYVEDLDGIARYGIVSTTVAAVGCTSRGQAHRVGQWILYSERLETEGIAFSCGTDATYLRPGNIFAVQGQHRAGIRYGGRIVSATAASVTIDAPITISSGQTYTIQVVLPDGTLATKTLTNAPGSATILTVSVDFAVTPVSPAVWVVTSSVLSPRLYRALSITEVERHKYQVAGIEHNPSKFDAIEQGLTLTTPRVSTITAVPATPANLTISESLSIRQGTVKAIMTMEWELVDRANRYRVEYRRDNGNYVALTDVRQASAEIVDAIPGLYDIRVVAVNVLGNASLAATASRQIYGKTARPENVQGFVVARTTDRLNFSWLAVADLDLDHYELRHGLTWEAGVPLGTTINTQYAAVTNLGGTYLIKAVDTSGNESLTASAIIIDANTDINVVVTANDAPAWAGTKVQTQADVTGVTLAGQLTWADLTLPWTAYTQSWIKTCDPYSTGTYETVPIDLAVVMTSRVELAPIVVQVPIGGTWADLTLPWTSYTDPWTGTPGLVSATYEMALSQDGSTWSAWQTYQSGHYLARAFKFRVTLSTSDANYLPKLTSLLVTIDVPDRVVHYEDQATVAGGTTLTFSPAFVNVQTVTGTIQAGAVGDTFRVTGKSNTQATVTVYDSAGTPKDGVVDIDVFGYGSI